MSSTSPAPPLFAPVLQPYVARQELAGAVVLAANRREILGLEAVGMADIAGQRPMLPDALCWIASMTKPITAAALMMLVDAGTVRVDDPVEAYLPEFSGQWLIVEGDAEHQVLRKPAHPITVGNILSHTSGMPFMSALEVPTLDRLTLEMATRSYAITPLQFPPDTRYEYSNAGINTAGRIIEVVSGQPYETFMDERLFGPLGMTDTTFWPSVAQLTRLAKTYRPTADGAGLEEAPLAQLQHPLDDRATRYPMPAGGLFSTAVDVARFCQMVLNDGVYQDRRFLSTAAVRAMTRKQTGDAVEAEYGFGWDTANGVFGHGGAHATNMTIDPRRDLITVYLVQHCGFPGAGGNSHGAFKAAAEAWVDQQGQ